jgi:hypothetical protein
MFQKAPETSKAGLGRKGGWAHITPPPPPNPAYASA